MKVKISRTYAIVLAVLIAAAAVTALITGVKNETRTQETVISASAET